MTPRNPPLSTLDLLLRTDFARANPERAAAIYRAATPNGETAPARLPDALPLRELGK